MVKQRRTGRLVLTDLVALDGDLRTRTMGFIHAVRGLGQPLKRRHGNDGEMFSRSSVCFPRVLRRFAYAFAVSGDSRALLVSFISLHGQRRCQANPATNGSTMPASQQESLIDYIALCSPSDERS